MIDLTLQIAEAAVKAAQGKAKALGSPMTVTVVDEAGRLVLSARGDGTGFLTPETSRAKATAAAAFRRSTAELTTLGAKGWGFWQVMPIVAQGDVLPTLGGAPIVVGGRVIGAIGCGGGTGEQDQECSDAGAAALAGSASRSGASRRNPASTTCSATLISAANHARRRPASGSCRRRSRSIARCPVEGHERDVR